MSQANEIQKYNPLKAALWRGLWENPARRIEACAAGKKNPAHAIRTREIWHIAKIGTSQLANPPPTASTPQPSPCQLLDLASRPDQPPGWEGGGGPTSTVFLAGAQDFPRGPFKKKWTKIHQFLPFGKNGTDTWGIVSQWVSQWGDFWEIPGSSFSPSAVSNSIRILNGPPFFKKKRNQSPKFPDLKVDGHWLTNWNLWDIAKANSI